jgi:hypothetical protein
MPGPRGEVLKFLKGWTRVGDKPSGYHGGGIYKDADGATWYVKEAPNEDHARNEALAAALYREAGVPAPEVDIIELENGRLGIASKAVPTARLDPDNPPPGTNEGFAADAWLGNWDAAGANFDNIMDSEGRAMRIDAGGSMEWRAIGGWKGDRFGEYVQELESLRNPKQNPEASRLFKGVTHDQMHAKGEEIRAIPESRIRELVKQYAPKRGKELADKLIARRGNLPAMFGAIGVGAAALGTGEEAEAGVRGDILKQIDELNNQIRTHESRPYDPNRDLHDDQDTYNDLVEKKGRLQAWIDKDEAQSLASTPEESAQIEESYRQRVGELSGEREELRNLTERGREYMGRLNPDSRYNYSDEDYYHGTLTPWDEDSEYDFERSDRGMQGLGMYMDADPFVGSAYAGGGAANFKGGVVEGANVMPLRIRKDAFIFDYNDDKTMVPKDKANAVLGKLGEIEEEAYPQVDKDLTMKEFAEILSSTPSDDRLIGDMLAESGFDGARIGSTVVMYRPEGNVKGKFAKYKGPGMMGFAGDTKGSRRIGRLDEPEPEDPPTLAETVLGSGLDYALNPLNMATGAQTMIQANLDAAPPEGYTNKWRKAREDREFIESLQRRPSIYGPENPRILAGLEAVSDTPILGDVVDFLAPMDTLKSLAWGDDLGFSGAADLALTALDFIPGMKGATLGIREAGESAMQRAIKGEADAMKEVYQSPFEKALKAQLNTAPNNVPEPEDGLLPGPEDFDEALGEYPRTFEDDVDAALAAIEGHGEKPYIINSPDDPSPGWVHPSNIQPKANDDLPFDQFLNQAFPGGPAKLEPAVTPGSSMKHQKLEYDSLQGTWYYPDGQPFEGDYSEGAALKHEFFEYDDDTGNWTQVTGLGSGNPSAAPEEEFGKYGVPKKATEEEYDVYKHGPLPIHETETEQLRREAEEKGLDLTPQGRMERAMALGHRFRIGGNPIVHHTGGHAPAFDEFKPTRGPMSMFTSHAPYEIGSRGDLSGEEWKRAIPVSIEGRIYGLDQPEDWWMPEQIDMSEAFRAADEASRNGGDAFLPPTRLGDWNAVDQRREAFYNIIMGNAPQELKDKLGDTLDWRHDSLHDLWATTVADKYLRRGVGGEGALPGDYVYERQPGSTRLDTFTRQTGEYDQYGDPLYSDHEYTFESYLKPIDYAVYEHAERTGYDPVTDRPTYRWPMQEAIQMLGYNAAQVSDESGYSIATRPEAARNWLSANYDPDRAASGINPSKNLMAGLGLTAASIPALMGMLNDDDEEDEFNLNGYF